MATESSETGREYVIVPFETADIDEIMVIEDKSFPAPWTRESYLELAPLDTISFFVVKHEKRVVGYMLYQTWTSEMELHTIAVEPGLRRRGIGRLMIEHLMSDAISRGVSRVFLQVRPSNEAARALYKAFGFYVVGVRHRYYRDNQEDALVMRCDVSTQSVH
jgi:ribosomal-protein-alanine N-acetyltransferase